MKRVLLALSAALLAACVGEPGANAPLQLTNNAQTALQEVRQTTASGRAVVEACYDAELRSYFASRVSGAHYGAIAVGQYGNGECYWVWFSQLNSVQSAQSTVLGICQNEGPDNCVVAANAVPDMRIPAGARTVSFGSSQFIANFYLNAPGYSSVAVSPNGFIGLGLNAPDPATADRLAMQRCAEDVAQGSGWNVDDPENATRIFRQEAEVCAIVNRRTPDGTMTPPVLP